MMSAPALLSHLFISRASLIYKEEFNPIRQMRFDIRFHIRIL